MLRTGVVAQLVKLSPATMKYKKHENLQNNDMGRRHVASCSSSSSRQLLLHPVMGMAGASVAPAGSLVPVAAAVTEVNEFLDSCQVVTRDPSLKDNHKLAHPNLYLFPFSSSGLGKQSSVATETQKTPLFSSLFHYSF